MSDEMTNDEKAETIIKSWFWQMSESHSFRWSKAVKSMTLFYESAPMSSDIAQLVVQYLKTREGVTDFIINHKKWHFDSPGWNAKEASYVTAPGEKWNGTESKKVRIYWTLVQAGDGTADGPYTVENGCKYRVTHEYYWDVAAQPTLPQSSSGVQYSIQGFTRDKETGLYTYIIEKRETIEQDIELYAAQKTIFEEVSEAQYLGVKQADVALKGEAAKVADASGDGTGGILWERKLTKNPDCTTDIANRKIEEKKVEEARTVESKKLRGTSVAVTDRNLTTSELATKTATTIGVGETRTVEKTPGNRRNLTVETFTPAQTPVTIAEGCEKSSAVETDTTVTTIDAENAEVNHQRTVAQNQKESVSYRINDDGKTADKTVTLEKHSLQTAADASQSGPATAASGNDPAVPAPQTTTVTRQQNATAQETIVAADTGVNKVVEVENQPNGMGGFNTVKRVTEYSEQDATGGSETGSVTVNNVQTSVVQTTTIRKQNATTQETIIAADRGVNKVVEVENTPNGMGGFNTVKRVTVHAEQTGGGTSAAGGTTGAQGTAAVESSTTRKQNATTQETIVAADTGANKVVEVENQPNGMGGFNTVRRETVYHEKTAVSKTKFATEESTKTVTTNTSTAPEPTCGTSDAQPNDHGSMTTSVTEITPNEIIGNWVEWTSTQTTTRGVYSYAHGIRVFVNVGPKDGQTAEARIAALKAIPAGATHTPGDVQISCHINRFGRYDGSLAYKDLTSFTETGAAAGGGSSTGSITVKGVSHNTIAFSGTGNEGSERYYKANAILVPGVDLPARTYFTS